jgi:hypothetical protein
MRPRGWSLTLLGLLLLPLPAPAQTEDWLPIQPQDLRIREVPGSPGAPAIQLYYADYIDDQVQSEFFYRRIKVLNDKGNRYADVEIVIPPEGSISGLKARTIHPDGRIIEFTGKPFQKVIMKGREGKFLAKAFTMPDVTVNSIIEYKYKIDLPGVVLDNSWTIQHELYTVKESFRMRPYGGLLDGFDRGQQVAVLSSHMPDNLKPQQKGGTYELEVENMPAFEAEGYMPPEEDYQPQIRFFYGGREIDSPEKFWRDAGRGWNEDAEHFIGSYKEIVQESSRVIGHETDPEQKLDKLYARAQQVRNLTYERERTEEEQKKESLKPPQNVKDVLARGYGGRDDITRFFVALARAAGFNVSILRVSNRREKFFDRGLLSRRQLDAEIAMVNRAGQSTFLDPGTRFCPFGFVRWMRTSSLALKLDKKGGDFIKVPSAGYEKAMIRRSAEATLSADGSLNGKITVRFEGGEALERRLDAANTDDAGRKEALEEEARDWLPGGASVKLIKVDGWEGIEEPLVATFAVELPSFASIAGRRLLVPTNVFQARQMDVFKHADRKYPVYFPYAFGEADQIAIQVPVDYRIETLPAQQSTSFSYATYFNEPRFDGKKLVTDRVLQVNGIFFGVEIYAEIKDFFRNVRVGDEQQAVFQSGESPGSSGAFAMTVMGGAGTSGRSKP